MNLQLLESPCQSFRIPGEIGSIGIRTVLALSRYGCSNQKNEQRSNNRQDNAYQSESPSS